MESLFKIFACRQEMFLIYRQCICSLVARVFLKIYIQLDRRDQRPRGKRLPVYRDQAAVSISSGIRIKILRIISPPFPIFNYIGVVIYLPHRHITTSPGGMAHHPAQMGRGGRGMMVSAWRGWGVMTSSYVMVSRSPNRTRRIVSRSGK